MTVKFLSKRRAGGVRPRNQLRLPERKFEHIHVDIHGLGALSKVKGKVASGSIIDRLTGYVRSVPLTGTTWEKIKVGLRDEWFLVFGLPSLIHMDNKIVTEKARLWLKEIGITPVTSAEYAHWQNGLVERYHRELNEGLMVLKNSVDPLEGRSWVN